MEVKYKYVYTREKITQLCKFFSLLYGYIDRQNVSSEMWDIFYDHLGRLESAQILPEHMIGNLRETTGLCTSGQKDLVKINLQEVMTYIEALQMLGQI